MQTHTQGDKYTWAELDPASPLYGKHKVCFSNEGTQYFIDHMRWIRGPLSVPQSPLYTAGEPDSIPSHLPLYHPPTPAPPASASQRVLSIHYRGSPLLSLSLPSFVASSPLLSLSLSLSLSRRFHVSASLFM